jgi:hypothetical protein
MGLCWTCLDRALVGRDQQEVMAILESMQACGDALLAVQAKKKLMELSQAVVEKKPWRKKSTIVEAGHYPGARYNFEPCNLVRPFSWSACSAVGHSAAVLRIAGPRFSQDSHNYLLAVRIE